MHDQVFKQYDIRGKVGSDFTIDKVYALAQAIAYYLKLRHPNLKQIAVGMDGRVHSLDIKERLCQGILDSGLNVLFIGVCPTPVLYFSLFTTTVDAGLMITASHNPKDYNGIKICLGKDALWGKEIQDILALFKAGKKLEHHTKGSYAEQCMIEPYINWLCEHFKHLQGLDINAIIDCGNGVAGTVLPRLIETMRWSAVELLYQEIDGTFPNHEADPTVEKNMLAVKAKITEKKYSLGLGFDGDCDRIGVMKKSGSLVSGDQLLALFSQDIIKKNPGITVVFDIKSSAGLSELLLQWGAQPYMSPSGHSIVKAHMKKTGALLGGELSCHFFFNDRYFGYDDGIYTMMRLFEILKTTDTSLEALLTIFPTKATTPEIRISCPEQKKQKMIQNIHRNLIKNKHLTIITLDGVHASADYGWGLIRASNTQPVLSLRFESNSLAGLDRIKKDFLYALEPYIDKATLLNALT